MAMHGYVVGESLTWDTENQGRGWLKSGQGSGSDTGFKYHPGDCQR